MRAAIFFRFSALILMAAFVTGGTSFAQGSSPVAAKHPASSQRAHVYLLKGLADVFSSGMDALEMKLRRQGIVAHVRSHAVAESLADEVARAYRSGARGPVIIVGHSLGADATVDMARRLNEYKIPVALIVSLGPLSSPRVPPNVARVINYYQSNSAWRGQMVRGEGFRGSLQNIDLDRDADINHFNIDKADRLHAATIAYIRAAMGGARKPASNVAAPGGQTTPTGAAAGASATRAN